MIKIIASIPYEIIVSQLKRDSQLELGDEFVKRIKEGIKTIPIESQKSKVKRITWSRFRPYLVAATLLLAILIWRVLNIDNATNQLNHLPLYI